MKRKIVLYVCTLFLFSSAFAQRNAAVKPSDNYHIKWSENKNFNNVEHLYFQDAFYKADSPYPFFSSSVDINNDGNAYSVSLINEVYEPFSTDVSASDLQSSVHVTSLPSFSKRQASVYFELIPLRKNGTTGQIERLVSFNVELKDDGASKKFAPSSARIYTSNSVLSSGDWFKIGVTADGVYKLTFDFLKSDLKMDLSGSPSSFRLYGNGGGMVPFINSAFRHDDLAENAVYVNDGGTVGVWDADDYVLFYGEAPVQWSYSSSLTRFIHQANYYSDSTFYYVTINGGSGTPKRINQVASLTVTPDFTLTTFDDYQFHELDKTNFIKSGREFYGEAFDINNSQTFSFDFPNMVSQNALVRTSFAGHSPGVTSSLNIKYNNTNLFTTTFNTPTDYTGDYALDTQALLTLANPTGSSIGLNYNFNPANSSCAGFLNYIEVQVKRSLSFVSTNNVDQFSFRDLSSVGVGKTALFTLSGAPSGVKVWNITDPTTVTEQVSNSGSFTTTTDSIKQFIAFGGSDFLSATAVGKIENQNLHSLSQADFIIITHPLFASEANRVADFHRTHDNMSVHVVNADEIYNEFSSGSKDAGGIRDFIKMFYDRGIVSGTQPKYVMLYGDGSYDNKNRITNNTNFIPSFESENGVSFLNSFVSDDFYGLMDDNEGLCNGSEKLDLGVGRAIVQTPDEAKTVADKIIAYASAPTTSGCVGCSNTAETLGDWRNTITFVADFPNGNTFISSSENLSNYMNANYKSYNVDKIYLNAYKQFATSAGLRFPDAQDAITKKVNKGSLIVNYIGHGGETGWSESRVLTNDDINSWTNINKLPIFITATCEFSRWDDPSRTSSGEKILLSSTGGAIALFTTTRLVYASSNDAINRSMIYSMFGMDNPRLGDIWLASKIQNLNLNSRNFSLLGDPALRMHYPRYKIEATTVNANPIIALNDTLSSLSKITIGGKVTLNGQLQTDFNGTLYPTIYDKPTNITTLLNDGSSTPTTFPLQKNILYKGKATVKNGEWAFTFIVPRDISYQYGLGKLSFYAENGVDDGAGYYDSIVVGGSSGNIINDTDGPVVKLYLNNEKFVYGGTTNDEPNIYCIISDSTGINITGNVVGHDIVAKLDSKTDPVYVLNDYYSANLDSYNSGIIDYPLSKLSEGRHTLEVTAWDILNNSSKSYTEFVVSSSAELALAHVLNYPNPFTTNTRFMFEYNKPCESLDVQVQVYTISGRLVKTISKNITSAGTRIDDLTWDGRDDYGDKIGRGVYIYRVKVNAGGETASKTEKLVILK